MFVIYLYNAVDGLFVGRQGLQPLCGQCCGRKDISEINWYFRSGITINLILSILIYIGLYFFDIPIIRIFNQEAELVKNTAAALPLFAVSFIPMAFNLIFTAYLFSTKRTGGANMIAISRGIVVKSLAIFLMPILFGTNAIWLAPLAAETITLALAFFLNGKLCIVYK